MKNPDPNPVHKAVMLHSFSALSAAISAGGNVEALDRENRTPLFYAAQDGELDIIAELIRQHADVNARDRNGKTPLHLAAAEYQVAAVDMLLKSGANVDPKDDDGNTPLAVAVFNSRGRGDLIRLLLASGADQHIKNNSGVSPESLAKSIGNFDVKQFLAS